MHRPSLSAIRRAPALAGAAVVLGTFAASGVAAESATADSACAASRPGLIATLGVWDQYDDRGPITAPERVFEHSQDYDAGLRVLGASTGLGRLADGSPRVALAARITPRGTQNARIVLCRGRTFVARLPAIGARERLGGLSANGQRVAWRVWTPGRRGRLFVGSVRGRRVVAVRRVDVPILRKRDAVDGRIAVMPDGTASWSLPAKGGPGVWLWPAGRAARRLAVPAAARDAAAWDVRVVDDRHMLLGGTDVVLRYGPVTPGRCPTPMGARVTALGPVRIVSVAGARTGDGWKSGSGWSQTLVCDPARGDYLHATVAGVSADSIGSSWTLYERALATAGVLVEQTRTQDETGAMWAVSRVTRLGDARTVAVPGAVNEPGGGYTPSVVGVRLAPGAVAWVTGPEALPDPGGPAAMPSPRRPASPSSVSRTIWVADADGPHQVGRIPAGAPDDPELTLDAGTVTWNDGEGVRSAPVRPVANDTVATYMPPR